MEKHDEQVVQIIRDPLSQHNLAKPQKVRIESIQSVPESLVTDFGSITNFSVSIGSVLSTLLVLWTINDIN